MVTFARRQRSPYIAKGLDQQGRIGQSENSLSCAEGIIIGVLMALAVWAALIIIWVTL